MTRGVYVTTVERNRGGGGDPDRRLGSPGGWRWARPPVHRCSGADPSGL